MPKISVIIAAYNMAEYLPLAIDSALVQDHPDFEVVVLDDGSTDNTREVVERYAGGVRYAWQANQGVAVAYNNLLEMADGEYVHFLDADDTLCAGALTRLAALLDEHAAVGLAYGAANVMDSAGRVYDKRTAPSHFERMRLVPSQAAFRELLRGCHITTSAIMLRKSVFETVAPFQQAAVPGEDWDMWMRVAAEYDLAYVPDTVANYRVHGTSITSAYTSDRVLASHEFTLRNLYEDPKFKFAATRRYATACLERTVALVAARGRMRRRFAGRLFAALRMHPALLLERNTVGVIYEGLKTLVPAPLISAGRRVRRGLATRGSGA